MDTTKTETKWMWHDVVVRQQEAPKYCCGGELQEIGLI